ncbi:MULTISPECIES: glycosyltransferase family 1 protein [unclassified Novosphingobium]|uniref:glycosyltransferase family 4 protein n=1 Tax=unclassified Novosphingobium TaxID=2644732 RepID=UPI001F446837|nr:MULTISPECIES: glycosyltransferase family 1 protein [unclassified Novosphingobium]
MTRKGADVQHFRIGIDGYNLAMPKGTGIATYGLNLARTLQSAGHEVTGVFGLHVGRDPALRETLFFDRVGQVQTGRVVFGGRWHRRFGMLRATLDRKLSPEAVDVPLTVNVDKETFAESLPAFDRLTSAAGLFPVAQRHFATTGRFLTLRMERPPEIMHWTYPVPVRIEGARNIYTVHDLVPLRLPYTTLTDKPRFTRLLRRCVAEADHLCTVSEFSRKDIIAQCGIDPARISNTYQTAFLPEEVKRESFEQSARQVKGLFSLDPRGYFLFFGALEPKKNLGRLIEAYLGLDIQTPLVLVGARAWMSEGELSLLPANDRRIVRLDYLGRNALLRLTRAARAVLFPSIFEGFGLPVLEAMQLGTPVLTSQRSSLPEVAGDAALLVDPYNTASIAEGIARLDGDAALREHLSLAGAEQAGKFSEAVYRERLQTMYAGVLATPAAGQGAV